MRRVFIVSVWTCFALLALAPAAPGGQAAAGAPAPLQSAATMAPGRGVSPPAGYLIGSDDVLSIVFWRDKDMSGDVVVRPDGKISLPLINDVQAAGLTPDQLRQDIEKAAARFIEDPNAAVIVKAINSRKVYVTGQVTKPGPYPLSGPTTVLQAISMAGGLLEYADGKHISIMRVENGRNATFAFNYKDAVRGKDLQRNIELHPGDTIVVP